MNRIFPLTFRIVSYSLLAALLSNGILSNGVMAAEQPQASSCPSDLTACPKISGVSPSLAYPTDTLTLSGMNFAEEMTIIIDSQSYPVTVTSPTTATFAVPEGDAGNVQLGIAYLGQTQSGGTFYRLDATVPTVVGDASLSCLGSTYYDGQGNLQNGTGDCSGQSQLTGIQSGDFISTVTIGTITGTLENCSSPGQVGCIVNGNYRTITKSAYDTNVAMANIPDCSSNLETDCIATATYRAAKPSDLTGNDVLAGETIAGVAGTYNPPDITALIPGNLKRRESINSVEGRFPSADHRLPRFSDDGGSVATTGSDLTDLDSTDFETQIRSNNDFEYWDASGRRYSSSGDADITAANLASGTAAFGQSGSFVEPTQCTSGVQGTCESDDACIWDSGSCKLNPDHIRAGVTLLGSTGSIKMNCRNYIVNSIYNSDGVPPANTDTTGASRDWWDTVDYGGTNSPQIPDTVTGWDANNLCGLENWVDVTSDGACDSSADDCVLWDKASNIYWTERGPTANSAPGGYQNWSSAVEHCHNLTFGGRSDWRLPTQMEVWQAYVRNMWEVARNYSNISWQSGRAMWTATSIRWQSGAAHPIFINDSNNHNNTHRTKTRTNQFVCVAP